MSPAPRLRSVAAGGALAVLAPLVACTATGQATCEPVAIAFVGPLSGSGSALGRPLRDGTALAVADHDASVRQRAPEGASPPGAACPVGLVELDTQGDPDQAVPIATQIANLPDVVAVVGPSLSGEAGAALPTFEQAGLAVVTPSATNAELGTRGWRSFHRMVTTDATQGPAAARYLTSLGLRRLALVDDGSLYGDGLTDLVASSVPGLAASIAGPAPTVVTRQVIDPASRDHTAVVREITASGADAVFFGGTDEPASRLVRQLREAGNTATFATSDAAFNETFLTLAGPAAEGALLTCPCAPAAVGGRPELRLFASRYLDTYGVAPGPFAAEAYDATMLLLDAIEAEGASRAGVAAFLDRADQDGITRRVRFDERGEVAEGPVFIYRVEGSRFRAAGQVVDDSVIAATPG